MSETNRAIVGRIHAGAESQGDLSVIDAAYAPDFVDGRHPERGRGPQGVKQHIQRLRTAFPDLQVNVLDLVAEGDTVVARVTSQGTHRGAFAGAAPTGARVTWSGMVLRRFLDGQIVEQWSQYDSAHLVRQLRETACSRSELDENPAPPL